VHALLDPLDALRQLDDGGAIFHYQEATSIGRGPWLLAVAASELHPENRYAWWRRAEEALVQLLLAPLTARVQRELLDDAMGAIHHLEAVDPIGDLYEVALAQTVVAAASALGNEYPRWADTSSVARRLSALSRVKMRFDGNDHPIGWSTDEAVRTRYASARAIELGAR
jgi:hypothetical protein